MGGLGRAAIFVRAMIARDIYCAVRVFAVTLFSAFFVALVTLVSPQASQAAELSDSNLRAVSGAWLLDPPYFDPMVDRGFIIPEFPVLLIKADGRFSLLRVFGGCNIEGSDGEVIDKSGKTISVREACIELKNDSQQKGLRSSYGQVNAEGRWGIEQGGRLRFYVESTGTIPSTMQASVQYAKEKLSEHQRQSQNPNVDQKVSFEKMDLQSKAARRMETFYTTFFIWDGTPRAYEISGRSLFLKGPEADEVISYRSFPIEVIDSAHAIVAATGTSTGKYFRCIVDKLDKVRDAKAGDVTELMKLTELAQKNAEAQFVLTQANAIRDKAPGEKGGLIRAQAAANQLQTLAKAINNHPGGRATKDGKFGAYLGCPERDTD